jgi:hypothetical protein
MGALCGWAVLFFGMLASMLAEPPEHFGVDFPLPNFWAADAQWRHVYLAGALIGSAMIGGAVGGIVGRIAFVLARRGVSPVLLRLGLCLAGAAGGFNASSTRIAVTATVVASAAATLLGAAVGNWLASSVLRSVERHATSGVHHG